MTYAATKPSRYVRTLVNGRSVARIDPLVLRQEIRTHLETVGPRTRTHIVRELHAHNTYVVEAVDQLIASGHVVTYVEGYHRGVPVEWLTVSGDPRVKIRDGGCFKAQVILERFQQAARRQLALSVPAAN
jgi:hypothetical protein